MTKMGKQIVSALLGIAFLLLLLSLCATVCKADELKYRIDYENCLYNMLHADDANDDWTTAKLYRAINMGITFVEGVSQANQIHDTVSFAPGTAPVDTSVFYALSTDAATGGVVNVVYLDDAQDELIALTKRPIEEFGKDHIGNQEPGSPRTYMFAEFGDSIIVYPRPDVDYVMHVFSYKVSDWLEGDSTEVTLPIYYRLLALEMAYAYAQLMTGTQNGFERYGQIRNNVLTAIYSVPPVPPKEIQPLGMNEGQ